MGVNACVESIVDAVLKQDLKKFKFYFRFLSQEHPQDLNNALERIVNADEDLSLLRFLIPHVDQIAKNIILGYAAQKGKITAVTYLLHEGAKMKLDETIPPPILFTRHSPHRPATVDAYFGNFVPVKELTAVKTKRDDPRLNFMRNVSHRGIVSYDDPQGQEVAAPQLSDKLLPFRLGAHYMTTPLKFSEPPLIKSDSHSEVRTVKGGRMFRFS